MASNIIYTSIIFSLYKKNRLLYFSVKHNYLHKMSNLFKTLEINGEKALKIIKEQAFNPEKTKTLKT